MTLFLGARPYRRRQSESERAALHWEGGCRTPYKKGHHSVNFGPIVAILGSKWPQRRDLLYETMFFSAKMDINCSKWLQNVIGRNRKGKTDQTWPIQSKIWVISSHFHIQNTFPNDRSTLCGHLEPKMVKIGPKLTKSWPFFWSVLHPLLHQQAEVSRSRFEGGTHP